jgi:hypothetical protein
VPFFEIYFLNVIRCLRGKGRLRGLDKIFGCVLIGVSSSSTQSLRSFAPRGRAEAPVPT